MAPGSGALYMFIGIVFIVGSWLIDPWKMFFIILIGFTFVVLGIIANYRDKMLEHLLPLDKKRYTPPVPKMLKVGKYAMERGTSIPMDGRPTAYQNAVKQQVHVYPDRARAMQQQVHPQHAQHNYAQQHAGTHHPQHTGTNHPTQQHYQHPGHPQQQYAQQHAAAHHPSHPGAQHTTNQAGQHYQHPSHPQQPSPGYSQRAHPGYEYTNPSENTIDYSKTPEQRWRERRNMHRM